MTFAWFFILINPLSWFSRAFPYPASVRNRRILSPLYPMGDSWERTSKTIMWRVSGTGLLPGLRQHFPDSPCLAGQTVILLNIPDHIHALLIGERTELFQKAFRRVLHGLVRCIAPGHVNFIQSGPLAGALDLLDHPFFSFT